MDIQQLLQFKEIAESNNITRVAEANFITQSALTRSLQRLEAELGSRLFDRKGKSLELNAAGRLVYGHVCAVLQEISAMNTELDALRGDTAAVTCYTESTLFAKYLLPELTAQLPQLAMHVQFAAEKEIVPDLLLSNQATLILTIKKLPAKNLCTTLAFEDRPALHVMDGSPLAGSGPVHLRELSGCSFGIAEMDSATMQVLQSLLQQHGVEGKYVQLKSLGYYTHVMRQSDLIGFTSTSMMHFFDQPGRKVLQIADKDFKMPFYAYYLKENEKQVRPILDWLRSFSSMLESECEF